jgi:hypothetical protein
MKRIRFVLLLSCSEAETQDGPAVACCGLHLALVPFTNVCDPKMVRARKCRCQCWVEEINGVAICAACCTSVNWGQATRGWKRRDNKEIQLDEEHKRIPDAIENPEAYLIAKEQQDYEPDWENQND